MSRSAITYRGARRNMMRAAGNLRQWRDMKHFRQNAGRSRLGTIVHESYLLTERAVLDIEGRVKAGGMGRQTAEAKG